MAAMFCPVCHAEYRTGFTRCADCQVDLVEVLIQPVSEREPAEELPSPRQESQAPHVRSKSAQSIAGTGDLFCPLCRQEFRFGAIACPDCNARLLTVGSQPISFPSRLFWITDHRETYQQVTDTLREAGIPFHYLSEHDHWLSALMMQRPRFEVLILKADVDAAMQALSKLGDTPQFEAETPDLKQKPLFHCPLCRSEYPEGYRHCPCCAVDLSAWDAEPLEPSEEDPPELVWRGGDPVMCSRAMGELRLAGIPFNIRSTSDHLAFELGMPRPKWEIRVYQSQAEQALSLVGEFWDTFPLTIPKKPEFSDALSDEEEPQAAVGQDTSKPAKTSVEIWLGNDEAQAQFVREVLRENAIGNWTTYADDGAERIVVSQRDESKAREVVRQVVGAP